MQDLCCSVDGRAAADAGVAARPASVSLVILRFPERAAFERVLTSARVHRARGIRCRPAWLVAVWFPTAGSSAERHAGLIHTWRSDTWQHPSGEQIRFGVSATGPGQRPLQNRLARIRA